MYVKHEYFWNPDNLQNDMKSFTDAMRHFEAFKFMNCNAQRVFLINTVWSLDIGATHIIMAEHNSLGSASGSSRLQENGISDP